MFSSKDLTDFIVALFFYDFADFEDLFFQVILPFPTDYPEKYDAQFKSNLAKYL